MTDLPKKLGKYEIRRALGRGAMGLVYEGYDPIIDRIVAIKTIKKEGLDTDQVDDYLQRFRSEARAAGRLQHPNIVTIYDFGEDGDVHYIVMELVHGRDLKSYFSVQHPFSLPQVGKLMSELLAALHYSHSRGVVHRDVKPDNVFITNDGSVKLGDFGIARIDASQRTHAGKLVGTPSYMAPEQIRGEPADARSDVYSAGVILYQFLVGERPFVGVNMMAVMQKVLMEAPKLPSVHDPKLPSVMDAVVMRALAKSARERFPSAQEFSRDLAWAIGQAAEDTSERTQIVPLDLASLAAPQEPTNPSLPSTGGVIVKPPSHASRLEERRRERQRLETKAAEWQAIAGALLDESTRLQASSDAVMAEGRLLLDGDARRRAAEDWAARGSAASDAVRQFVGSADLLTLESQEALEEQAATLDAAVTAQQAAAERLRREASAATAGLEQGLRILDKRLAEHDDAWASLEAGLEAMDPHAGEAPLADADLRATAVVHSMDQVAQSVAAVRRQPLKMPARLADRLTDAETRLESQRSRGAAVRGRLELARQAAAEAAEARRLEQEARQREAAQRQREAEQRRREEEARQREEAARREAEARVQAQTDQRLAQAQALLEESNGLADAEDALRREGRLLLDGAAQERAAEAIGARLQAARDDLLAWLDSASPLPPDARVASKGHARALADAAALHERAAGRLREDAESARSDCKQKLRALEKKSSGHDAAWALEEAAVRALDVAAGDPAIADGLARTAALERGMAEVGEACKAWRAQPLKLPPALLERVGALEARLDAQRDQAVRVRNELAALRGKVEAERLARQQQAEQAKRRVREEEERRQAQAAKERRDREAAEALQKTQAAERQRNEALALEEAQERSRRAAEAERRKAAEAQARQQAESIERQQEQARQQAEAIRRQQEQARQQAEAIRRQQEQEQQQAEAIRRLQEQERRQAESIERQREQERQQAEAIQRQQEQERQQAEAIERQQEQERQAEAIRQRQEEEARLRREAEAALARAAADLARRQETQARARAQPWLEALDERLAEVQALVAAADAVMSEGRLLIDGAAGQQAAELVERAREACEGAQTAADEVEPHLPDLAAALEARRHQLIAAVSAQQAWVERLRREEQGARSNIEQRLRGLERLLQASETALAGLEKSTPAQDDLPEAGREQRLRASFQGLMRDLDDADASWKGLSSLPFRLPAGLQERAAAAHARLDDLHGRARRVQSDLESARPVDHAAEIPDRVPGQDDDAGATIVVTPAGEPPFTPALVVPAAEERATPHRPQAGRAVQPGGADRRVPWLPIGGGVVAAAVLAAFIVPRFMHSSSAPADGETNAASVPGAVATDAPPPSGSASSSGRVEPAASAGAGNAIQVAKATSGTEKPASRGGSLDAAPAARNETHPAPPTAAPIGTPPAAKQGREASSGGGQAAPASGTTAIVAPRPQPPSPLENPPSPAPHPPGASTPNGPNDRVAQGPAAPPAAPPVAPPASAAAVPPVTSPVTSPVSPPVAPPVTPPSSGAIVIVDPRASDPVVQVASLTPKEKFEQGERDFKAGKSRGFEEMKAAFDEGYADAKRRACELVASRGHPNFNEEVFCKH